MSWEFRLQKRSGKRSIPIAIIAVLLTIVQFRIYDKKNLINLCQKANNLRSVIILALEILYILSGIVSLITAIYSLKMRV